MSISERAINALLKFGLIFLMVIIFNLLEKARDGEPEQKASSVPGLEEYYDGNSFDLIRSREYILSSEGNKHN